MTLRNRYLAAMLIVASTVAACGGDDDVIAKVGDRSVTRTEFEAFLALKRIPKDDAARSERLLTEYLEREALADVIEQEKVLDQAQVTAEVREFEKELL